jgi:hypothetical protein
MKKTLLVVLVCGLMAAFAPSLLADEFGQAFNAAYSGQSLSNGPYTLGWSFNVTAPINVTGLAVFQDNGVPLQESHDVGIWDSSGTLLVSGIVTNAGCGVVDQLGQQDWCVVGAAATLTPGTYTIGAVWLDGADPMIFPGEVGNVNGPSVVYLQNEYIEGGVLTDPITNGGGNSYFGPNFTTPEPASLALLGCGLLGLAGLRRKIGMSK